MTVRFVDALRSARAAEIVTLADNGVGGTTNAKLKLYTGAGPGNVNSAATGTHLGDLNLAGKPCFTYAAGVSTLGTVNNLDSALADGTIGYVRLCNSDDVAVAEFTASATGGGGDIQFDTVSVTTGATVSVTSGTITEGNAPDAA